MGSRAGLSKWTLLWLAGIGACVWCGAGQAATLVPEESTLSLRIGPLPQMTIPAAPGAEALVTLADDGGGGHQLILQSNVWTTLNWGPGSSLFTGIPLLSHMFFSVANRAGTFTSGHTHVGYIGDSEVVGPFLGGDAPLTGHIWLQFLKGVISLPIEARIFGQYYPPLSPSTSTLIFPPLLTSRGSPWVTGPASIVSITTNLISVNGVTGVAVTLRPAAGAAVRTLSTGGGLVSTGGGLPAVAHTVIVSGSNQLLSAGGSGRVTLVSPVRIDLPPGVGSLTRVPGQGRMTLRFVPEPGTLVLLVTGAAALVRVGRRRRH